MANIKHELTGRCRICHQVHKLYVSGLVWRHKSPYFLDEWCEGSKRPPQDRIMCLLKGAPRDADVPD